MDVSPANFAVSKGERVQLEPPAPGRIHIHLPSSSRVGIGCTTSRRCDMRAFWELAAFRLGCTVDEAKRRARK